MDTTPSMSFSSSTNDSRYCVWSSGVGVFLFRVLYHRKATAAFIKREIKVTTAKPGQESI